MKLPPAILSCLVGVLWSGCANPASPAARQVSYVKPGLIILTVDQAAHRGIRIPEQAPPAAGGHSPLDASAVEAAPQIKAYTLNRSLDPADRSVMHEEHIVYRRETPASWKLDAPAERKLLIGPRITDGRQDLRPLLDKEIITYLSDQRRAQQATEQALAALFKAVEALNRQQQAVIERDRSKAPVSNDESPDAAQPSPGGRGGEEPQAHR